MSTADEHPIASAARSTVPALQAALSGVLAVVALVTWAVTGRGYLWPVWVWLAVAIPLGAQLALARAQATPPGRPRALAVHAAVTAVLAGILLCVWAFTAGGGGFWPVWPLLVFGTLLAVHGAVYWQWEARSGDRERVLSDRVDVLTRTRRGALDVQAAELRRIERDLHDGAQARLVALSMQLGRAEARLEDRPDVAELLRAARGEAGAAIAELRDLARGIAPPVLADRGLAAAVEALARRAAIPVEVDVVALDRRPPPVVETAAYFVVSEALTNVAKHAGGAAARVRVGTTDDRLVIVVADDGPGGADAHGGGLTGLRHRVEALDGDLQVITGPHEGTTIRAELPCES